MAYDRGAEEDAMLNLLFALAAADPYGTVGYHVEDVQLDMGDFHAAVGVGASVLGKEQRLFVDGTLLLELTPSLSVQGMGTIPFFDLSSDDTPWAHQEVGLAFHKTTIEATMETIMLEQNTSTYGDTTTTNTLSAQMPVLERSQFGLGLGAIYRQGLSRLGKEDDTETRGVHVLPYAGMFFSSGIGQSVSVQGYGRREVYRFVWGGADLVYSAISDTDATPTGDLNDFGMRVHGNVSIGRPNTLGLGARVELGAFPGGLGGYVIGSLSLTTNLRLLHREGGRRARKPRNRKGSGK